MNYKLENFYHWKGNILFDFCVKGFIAMLSLHSFKNTKMLRYDELYSWTFSYETLLLFIHDHVPYHLVTSGRLINYLKFSYIWKINKLPEI